MRRFTLRDLFWLTLVVGLTLGWALDRGRVEDQRQAAEARAIKAEVAAGQLQAAWDRMPFTLGPKPTYEQP